MQKAKRGVNKLNQKTAGYPMGCAIFSGVINLAWNTGIILNQTDIDAIIKTCETKGYRTKTGGGWIKPVMTEIYNYAIIKNPGLNYSVFTKDSPNLKFYYDKGYMIACGIAVNNKFLVDKKDNAKIDTAEYKELAGQGYKHCTNLIKGFGGKYEGKDYVNDSYYGNSDNLYEVNLKEMVEDILQNTCYFYYLK